MKIAFAMPYADPSWVRLYFDSPITADAALLDPANYYASQGKVIAVSAPVETMQECNYVILNLAGVPANQWITISCALAEAGYDQAQVFSSAFGGVYMFLEIEGAPQNPDAMYIPEEDGVRNVVGMEYFRSPSAISVVGARIEWHRGSVTRDMLALKLTDTNGYLRRLFAARPKGRRFYLLEDIDEESSTFKLFGDLSGELPAYLWCGREAMSVEFVQEEGAGIYTVVVVRASLGTKKERHKKGDEATDFNEILRGRIATLYEVEFGPDGPKRNVLFRGVMDVPTILPDNTGFELKIKDLFEHYDRPIGERLGNEALVNYPAVYVGNSTMFLEVEDERLQTQPVEGSDTPVFYTPAALIEKLEERLNTDLPGDWNVELKEDGHVRITHNRQFVLLGDKEGSIHHLLGFSGKDRFEAKERNGSFELESNLELCTGLTNAEDDSALMVPLVRVRPGKEQDSNNDLLPWESPRGMDCYANGSIQDSSGYFERAASAGTCNGFVRIDSEYLQYVQAKRTKVKSVLQALPEFYQDYLQLSPSGRGALGSKIAPHKGGTKVMELIVSSNNQFFRQEEEMGQFFEIHPLEFALQLLLSTGTGENWSGTGTNYDTRPAHHALGIPHELVDIDAFEQLIYEIAPLSRMSFVISPKERRTFFEFISQEICLPLGAVLLLDRQGRITVRSARAPLLSEKVPVIDSSSLLLSGTVSHRDYPHMQAAEITIRYDKDDISGDFHAISHIRHRHLRRLYPHIKPLSFEFCGIKEDLGGANDVREFALRKIEMFGRPLYGYSFVLCGSAKASENSAGIEYWRDLKVGDVVRLKVDGVPSATGEEYCNELLVIVGTSYDTDKDRVDIEAIGGISEGRFAGFAFTAHVVFASNSPSAAIYVYQDDPLTENLLDVLHTNSALVIQDFDPEPVNLTIYKEFSSESFVVESIEATMLDGRPAWKISTSKLPEDFIPPVAEVIDETTVVLSGPMFSRFHEGATIYTSNPSNGGAYTITSISYDAIADTTTISANFDTTLQVGDRLWKDEYFLSLAPFEHASSNDRNFAYLAAGSWFAPGFEPDKLITPTDNQTLYVSGDRRDEYVPGTWVETDSPSLDGESALIDAVTFDESANQTKLTLHEPLSASPAGFKVFRVERGTYWYFPKPATMPDGSSPCQFL